MTVPHDLEERFPHVTTGYLFDEIAADRRRAILDRFELRTCPADTVIITQNAPSQGLFLLLAGSVRISYATGPNSTVTLHEAGPGEILGDIEAVADLPNMAECRAETDCELLFLDKHLLSEDLADPLLRRNLMRFAYHRLSFANRHTVRQRENPVEDQVIACLVQLSWHDPVIDHPQSYVADMVGCSRQTVNKVLQALREAGTVQLSKGKIMVLDRDALRQKLI